MTGEAASVDKKAAGEYPAILNSTNAEGGYSAKQVFNVDETGLYQKKIPNKTYISAEATPQGFKGSLDCYA